MRSASASYCARAVGGALAAAEHTDSVFVSEDRAWAGAFAGASCVAAAGTLSRRGTCSQSSDRPQQPLPGPDPAPPCAERVASMCARATTVPRQHPNASSTCAWNSVTRRLGWSRLKVQLQPELTQGAIRPSATFEYLRKQVLKCCEADWIVHDIRMSGFIELLASLLEDPCPYI
jgi:hypothetical protein